MIGLIGKVLVFSTALAMVIKYGAPVLPLAPTTTNALLAVWLPATLAALALGWRWQQQRKGRKAAAVSESRTYKG
jgi:membrane protein implicated in regulation of membrane protease activity